MKKQGFPTDIESASDLHRLLDAGAGTVLLQEDCLEVLKWVPDSSIDLTVTSPPYCMGKAYERTRSVHDFIRNHKRILPEIVRVTKPGGSICWQVGSHVENGRVTPLDALVFAEMQAFPDVHLRNRIVWAFGHGAHTTRRFSGRYEVILWFTKGTNYFFDLDAVRVPQKYPGKRHFKGRKKGELSGNPMGKNPSDVWEIPNVKANHVEKTDHPCQFPVGIPQRLIRALTKKGAVVFDPYAGSGTTAVAAILEGRRFFGCEVIPAYLRIARERVSRAISGKIQVRPINKPILMPPPNLKVTKKPAHFWQA